jgi:hypothetical protein
MGLVSKLNLATTVDIATVCAALVLVGAIIAGAF